MYTAEYSDKAIILDILVEAFNDNNSVNYIIKQDKKRLERIKCLMNYSFEVCYRFGHIFLADNKKGCALVLLPDKKTTTPKSIILDVRLILSCISLQNMVKIIRRESMIKRNQPDLPMYYLWFIGVEDQEQNKGIGSQLLNEILIKARSENRIVCLETSTLKNISWYKKFGFEVYKKLDFGFQLFFLRNN